MNDATVRFGYDGTALNAGLAEGERRLKTFSTRASDEFARAGGAWTKVVREQTRAGSMRGLGQVSMQLQDIAVQAQMGTKASIIVAQQLPQMMGAFGATGAIAGGVVAIGGALYSMGEKATAAFEEAKSGAVEFERTMRTAAIGSTNDLIHALSSIESRSISLKNEMRDLSGFMPALTEMMGGPSVEDRINFTADQTRRTLEMRREMGQQLVTTSNQETELARLRAAGSKEEADALETKIKLSRELDRIQNISADGWVKDQLSANAIEQATLKPTDTVRAREQVMALESRINEQKLAALDPVERYLELSTQQEKVIARMATEGGMFYEQSVAGLSAWADAVREMGDVEGLAKVLGMMEEVGALQSKMNQAEREAVSQREKRDQDADAKRKEVEAVKAKSDAEQERFAEYYKKQQEARAGVREDIAMAYAKMNGNEKLLAQMEREKKLREETKRIKDATNVSDEQARRSAEIIIGADDYMPAAREARAGRRGRSGPLAPNSGPLYRGGPLSRNQGPLFERGPNAPGSPDASRAAAAAKPADVGGKIDKTNELLARGLLGG